MFPNYIGRRLIGFKQKFQEASSKKQSYVNACSECTLHPLLLLTTLRALHVQKKGERQTTGTHFLCLVSWRACRIVGRGALDVERMGGPGLRSPALFFLLGLRPKWLFGIPVMTAKMQPSFVPALDHPQFSLPVHNNIWFAQYNLFITCSSSPRSYEYIP